MNLFKNKTIFIHSVVLNFKLFQHAISEQLDIWLSLEIADKFRPSAYSIEGGGELSSWFVLQDLEDI